MKRPDPRQFDLFAAPARAATVDRPIPNHRPSDPNDHRRWVKSSAWGGAVMLCGKDDPDPIEIEVRGMPIVISFGYGFAAHAVRGPGSLFISETGFRSFTMGLQRNEVGVEQRDAIAAHIARFIDAPTAHGNGCGGKLKPWWPGYALQWRDSLAFALSHDRATTWNQWGPEQHAEHWAGHDRRQRSDLEKMRLEGIDPDDIGPPSHFKGKWPKFGQGGLL